MARASKLTSSKCLFTGLLFAFLHAIVAIEETPVFNYGVGFEPDIHLDKRLLVRVQRQAITPDNATTPTSTTNFTGSDVTVGNETSSSQNVTMAPPIITTSANNTTQRPTTTPPTSPGTPIAPPAGTDMPNITYQEDRKYYIIKTIMHRAIYTRYWTDLSNDVNGVRHKTLSEGHRLAQTVQLKFNFRFYGHTITNVTIATGGFLYMSPFLHRFLTATQYIAPLMANFDTSLGNESNIRFLSTKSELIVQWENVHLKDQLEFGRFNFQVHLKQSGDIVFVYRDVPVRIAKILEDNHPVKVGLSDAFYIDKDDKKLGMKRRTIYEYHRVSINLTQVLSSTVVILQPNPTCNTAKSCESCLTHHPDLGCAWCGVVQRCSDGIDWHRQHWLDRGCKYLSSKLLSSCALYRTVTTANTTSSNPTTATPSASAFSAIIPVIMTATTPLMTTSTTTSTATTSTTSSATTSTTTSPAISTSSSTVTSPVSVTACGPNVVAGKSNCSAIPNVMPTPASHKKSGYGFPPGAVIALIILVALIIGVAGWFFYAYRNPTTASGIWLMEHRPVAMKTKLAKMKFWKQSTPTGDKYAVESEA